jgi:hypothetical protein
MFPKVGIDAQIGSLLVQGLEGSPSQVRDFGTSLLWGEIFNIL